MLLKGIEHRLGKKNKSDRYTQLSGIFINGIEAIAQSTCIEQSKQFINKFQLRIKVDFSRVSMQP